MLGIIQTLVARLYAISCFHQEQFTLSQCTEESFENSLYLKNSACKGFWTVLELCCGAMGSLSQFSLE